MEERLQGKSGIIRAVSLVSKWGTMVIFFKRLDAPIQRCWGMAMWSLGAQPLPRKSVEADLLPQWVQKVGPLL